MHKNHNKVNNMFGSAEEDRMEKRTNEKENLFFLLLEWEATDPWAHLIALTHARAHTHSDERFGKQSD